MIRDVCIDDAQQLADIYNYYVKNSIITFDTIPVSKNVFVKKIESISQTFPFLVYEEEGEILGYCYANKFREKPAYKTTAETTIYVKHNAHRKQIGSKLYAELLSKLKQHDLHMVIGGLSLPNEASVKLHEKFGFKKIAHFSEVGFKLNKWVDVGFWELKLEK